MSDVKLYGATLANALLAEEFPFVDDIVVEKFNDVLVRDYVLHRVVHESNNYEHYSREEWFPKIVARLEQWTVRDVSSDVHVQLYTTMAALEFLLNEGKDKVIKYLDKGKELGGCSFINLIERALTIDVGSHLLEKSILMLSEDEVAAGSTKKKEVAVNMVTLSGPKGTAQYLHDECSHDYKYGFLEVTTDGELVSSYFTHSLDAFLEMLDIYPVIETKFVLLTTVDFDVESLNGLVSESDYLDVLFINYGDRTFRSLICTDVECCPVDGVLY